MIPPMETGFARYVGPYQDFQGQEFFFWSPISPNILKARPHESLLTSQSRSPQHRSFLCFMPCLRDNIALSHISCSAESPFKRVYLLRSARHPQCSPEDQSFHQYMQFLAGLCAQRGIKWPAILKSIGPLSECKLMTPI